MLYIMQEPYKWNSDFRLFSSVRKTPRGWEKKTILRKRTSVNFWRLSHNSYSHEFFIKVD